MASHSTILYLGLAFAAALALYLLFLRYKDIKNWESLDNDSRLPVKGSGPELARRIRLSKQQLETTFDAITDPIAAIDGEFKIARVNKSYAQHVNLPIPLILGRTCFAVFWGKKQPCPNCPAQTTFATGNEASKKNVSHDDDTGGCYDISTYPVVDRAGTTVNCIEYIRDVTEEKHMLDQLIRSEKLATVGVMTAGIAHEMNNPLSGISGTAANMLGMPQKYGLNEKGINRISTILESAQRATVIMKDLLNFSRKQESREALQDLNALVQRALSAIHLGGFNAIKKELLLDKKLAPVLCDPVKIEQVIVNLITNAAQAIADRQAHEPAFKGVITLSTTTTGAFARVDIADNGPGIPEAIRAKIFDPFFTTRPPGEGTGLGLCICYKIMQDHQGRILFESRDTTTVFSILLPRNAPGP
ncbi:MAG: ATP-binding protein [Chitinivibrionales bacterium]|nr:ATP-binding protein [Chitinivibrionales bacterium]